MKYNLQWIVKHQGYFEIDEAIIFPQEMFEKFAQINNLKDVTVQGTGNLDVKEKRLYVELSIKGVMVLPCALTLDEVDYPFDIQTQEVFSFEKPDPLEEVHEVKKNMVDLTPIVFENIMIEVPMRVVKEDASIQVEGKGWKIFKDESETKDDDYIDPRLAKLKDYFKDK